MDFTKATTFSKFPGAFFHGDFVRIDDLRFARDYERVVADYARDGVEEILWEDLRRLGFERYEIQWHADHPGARMEWSYA